MDTVFIPAGKDKNYPTENGYTLYDENNNIIVQRLAGTLAANTIYRDTIHATPGCYRYEITDKQ